MRRPRPAGKASPLTSAAGALLFDMDGVVVDNMGYHVRAWRKFLSARGLKLEAGEFIRRMSGVPTRGIFERVLERRLGDEEAAALDDEKESLYRKLYLPHLKPARGLVEFLDKSRRSGLRIGLGTGSLPENISFVLDGLSLRSRFDAIVGAGDVRNGKPHPETFLKLARRLGAEPGRCVVFEDSLLGERAARAAGMAVVAVTTSHEAREFAGPDLAIPDFAEIEPADVLRLI